MRSNLLYYFRLICWLIDGGLIWKIFHAFQDENIFKSQLNRPCFVFVPHSEPVVYFTKNCNCIITCRFEVTILESIMMSKLTTKFTFLIFVKRTVDLYSASSQKQQSTGRNVNQLRHNIVTPVLTLTPVDSVLGREAVTTIFSNLLYDMAQDQPPQPSMVKTLMMFKVYCWSNQNDAWCI